MNFLVSIKSWIMENPKRTIFFAVLLGFIVGCYFQWKTW